jgi:hypothetical protein
MLDSVISLIGVIILGLMPWRRGFIMVSGYTWKFLVGPQKNVSVFVSWGVVQQLLANALVVAKGFVLMQSVVFVGVNSLVGLGLGLAAHYWWDYRNNAHPALVFLFLSGIYGALDITVWVAFACVTMGSAFIIQSMRLGVVVGCVSVFAFIGFLGALPMLLMVNLVISILILVLYWTVILQYMDHGAKPLIENG